MSASGARTVCCVGNKIRQRFLGTAGNILWLYLVIILLPCSTAADDDTVQTILQSPQQPQSASLVMDQTAVETQDNPAFAILQPANGQPPQQIVLPGPPPPGLSLQLMQSKQQYAQPPSAAYGGGGGGGGGSYGGGGYGDYFAMGGGYDMPQILGLDVRCDRQTMNVQILFDRPFYGMIFSKGYFNNPACRHVPPSTGKTQFSFEISTQTCGTSGSSQAGTGGYGGGGYIGQGGLFFENTIIIQYDPLVQEVWDVARRLRCTWHDFYEKHVAFKPLNVDMLDVVRADFNGDNVGCWMQIQLGKGPFAPEASGIVKIGQTMTMVLAIKDKDSKFDMLVRDCSATDGRSQPILLVDGQGCILKPKLMGNFQKMRNVGQDASVLSFAHFQAFKFPDTMEVRFQCTIQICRFKCPLQCSGSGGGGGGGYGVPMLMRPVSYSADLSDLVVPDNSLAAAGPHRRRRRRAVDNSTVDDEEDSTDIGLNGVLHVVGTGDLAFSLDPAAAGLDVVYTGWDAKGLVCLSRPSFAGLIATLLLVLVSACLFSAYLCLRRANGRGLEAKKLGCSVVGSANSISKVGFVPASYWRNA